MTPSRTPPRERLAAPVQLLSLSAEANQLRGEQPAASSRGHRQVALVKRGSLSVILFAFDAGGALKEHSAPGEVTIHVLTGSLAIAVDGDEMTLRAGDMLTLAPGIKHSVHASEPSDMLLTISVASG